MKKIIILAAVAAASLFCSCQKENTKERAKNEMVPFEITLNTDLDEEFAEPAQTRIWLQGSDKSLRWAADDKVSVYDGVVTADGGIQFSVATRDGSNATLSGEISGSAEGPIYFHYPYQKYVASRGNTNYTTNISEGVIFPVEAPYSYSTKTAQIPAKSLMLVGKLATPSTPGTVTMKTPMGFAKFTLKTDPLHPVTKIEITSENSDVIAGTFGIDCTGDDPVLLVQGRDAAPFDKHPSLTGASGGKQKCAYDITLTPDASYSGEFIDGSYYFALPPQEYNWGIRIRFTDDSGMIAEKRPASRNALVINRGKIKNLGTIDMADLDWYEAIDVKVMRAITDCVWPFNEANPGNFTTDGALYEFTYGPDNEPFKMKSANIYNGGMWSTTGINIRGKKAYIQIPGRTGKLIHEVALRVGAQGGKCGNPIFADASDPDGEGKYNILKTGEDDPMNPGSKLPGQFERLVHPADASTDNAVMDAWWGNKQFGWTKRWTNFESEEATDYRIYLTETTDYLKIIDLTILYVDTPVTP